MSQPFLKQGISQGLSYMLLANHIGKSQRTTAPVETLVRQLKSTPYNLLISILLF
jgi:hypothetical protein